MTHTPDSTTSFISPQERTRLVRLCAAITGDREVAEDLAQETLFEAWRHLEGLRDPQKRSQWLTGIARNICRRWRRQRGLDLARYVPLEDPTEQEGVRAEEGFADAFVRDNGDSAAGGEFGLDADSFFEWGGER